MPLSKANNKERMRQVRATRVQPNPITSVQPKLAEVGLKMEGNTIVGLVQPVKPSVQPKVYSPRLHRAGDIVRMRGTNIEVVVPLLDADGQPVPDY